LKVKKRFPSAFIRLCSVVRHQNCDYGHKLLYAVPDYAEIDASLMELFEVYQSQALDLNVNMKRLMDQWRA